MSLTINTNVASLIAQYNLSRNIKSLNKTTEKLSTGQKINNSSDDAAGLSISEKLRTQIRGSQKASENAQDGINLLQVAEGSISTVLENLQRIREITVQAANDTNTSVERAAIRMETATRIADIDRLRRATNFNGINLLDGSHSSYILRIGPNSNSATNTIDIASALQNMLPTFLSVQTTTTALSNAFLSGTNARGFLNTLDNAIKTIIDQRANIGALQNRLQSTHQNLETYRENIMAAESRVRNVDIAAITAELAKNQILQQASVSVMSQANQLPGIAIELLKNSFV